MIDREVQFPKLYNFIGAPAAGKGTLAGNFSEYRAFTGSQVAVVPTGDFMREALAYKENPERPSRFALQHKDILQIHQHHQILQKQ